MKSIWIVDDDESIRFVLQKALARDQLPVTSFSCPSQVLAALDKPAQYGQPLVLVSDIRMPDPEGLSGLDLLNRVQERLPALPVIVMTAFSDLDSAVSAFQGGAFEYLPKPFDVPKAVELIRRAAQESQREEFTEEADENVMPQEILGQAPAMQDVFRAIGRLSQSHVTVLVTGASGTGKELVARALHRHSPRAKGPFVAINTAAIPKDLLESELFGHERGSFTGAQAQRRGRFEQAEGGTLFLDEIGDMPFELQTRLLRVLSDGHFYRVGGHSAIKANVRIIAATHQNLEDRVRLGEFREDLFHRLNVIRLRLPALHERREDVPILVRHFLQTSAQQLGVEPKRLSDEAMQRLSAFSFPGNVRQLENICHWLTVMSPSQIVEVKDLPPEVLTESATAGAPAPSAASDAALSFNTAPAALRSSLPPEGTDTTASGSPSVSGGTVIPVSAPVTEPMSLPQGWPTTDGHALMDLTQTLATDWKQGLAHAAQLLLEQGRNDIWEALIGECERTLIRTALHSTHQRRIEAAHRLGIGRNTITRKIQELGLE
ncbi:nitrogen regulation protein NR(I) [Brachymonas sp.]|uniref:nitrogen regulation protein NR(I) n=1 Tax=Brachymonas sp. TaxID=1936292 RepID=UPI0035AF52C6